MIFLLTVNKPFKTQNSKLKTQNLKSKIGLRRAPNSVVTDYR